MLYIACQNEECANRGAPYTNPDAASAACPVCGEPLSEIPAPDLTPPTPTPEPLPTPEEILDRQRATVAGHIRSVLASSDLWAIRHVEDGASLTPERIAYRKQLRTLLDSVATSDDPASIEIPDPPPPPK